MLLLTAMLLGGCAASGAGRPVAKPSSIDARGLVAFDRDGQPVDWSDMVASFAEADVIILGEQHNDGAGHAVQLAVVEDALARWDDVAVSLEMLERDEQPIVDDYLEGVIDAEQFATLTFSTTWAGPESWTHWYQPVIDAAKEHDARVIAANAPRRYVRLARTEGYERLDELPPPRSTFFDRPDELPDDEYRRRFSELMGGGDPSSDPHGGGDDAAHQEMVESLFRAQMVWDATMAASIDSALGAGATKVIHLVGQFHSDAEGGTVGQLRRLRPSVRVTTISLQPMRSDVLRDEDSGIADFVIYTG
ncbi:MAG: ChaN family lipoprotein [Planctomycetota bacterium]